LFDFAISRISSYHPSAEIRTAFEGPQFTKPMVTATVFFGVGAALTIMLGHIKIAIGERSSGPVSKLSWSLTMMPLYVISIIVSLTIGVRIVISEFRKPDSAKTVLATFVAIFVGGTLAIACALISYRQDELDRGKDQPYGVAECLAPVLFHICCVVSHSLYLIVAMRKRLKYRFHWTSATALALELVAIASLGTILLLSFDPYFAWTTEYNYWFYVAIILACKLIALVLAHSNRDYI
jgi:succinate dehydrogenase hydrophobic anchor subunit